MKITKDDKSDEIGIIRKVEKRGRPPFSSSHNIIDIDQTERFIVLLTQGNDDNFYIRIFDNKLFPQRKAQIMRIPIKTSKLLENYQDIPI